MRELFIYYRSHAADASALQEAARTLQRTLRVRHPWLEARLLRKSGPRDELVTWMETYRSVDLTVGVIDAQLVHDIEDAAADLLGEWLAGPRHVEEFEPCAW